MDFSKIDLAGNADRGADCHIDHPVTGEPLYTAEGKPITIRVVGQDSREFRGALSAISEKKRGKVTLESAEANAVELIAKAVTGWHGIQWEGADLPCTHENVRMFLTKFPPIRAQLDAFIADRANFFRAGGKK